MDDDTYKLLLNKLDRIEKKVEGLDNSFNSFKLKIYVKLAVLAMVVAGLTSSKIGLAKIIF